MTPRISVIVPVYNVSPYLRRCLDSLLNQTLKDYEVILIDDGSTDDSATICEEYVSKDFRFTLIRKQNGGLSSARNAGLDRAKGEAIAFIDSDDSTDPRMLEILYESLEKTGADMAVCDYYDTYGDRIRIAYGREEHFVCNGQEAYGFCLSGKKTGASVCTKLFRRISIGDLRFKESTITEDAEFMSRFFPRIRKTAFELLPLYYWHHRKHSITTQQFNERCMETIRVYQDVYIRVKKNFPTLEPQAMFRLEWAYFIVFDQLLNCDNYRMFPQYRELHDFLRNRALRIAFDCQFRGKRRIAAFALIFSVPLYRFLLKRKDYTLWKSSVS
jgi:glycosyltransferase involved in cell wall biosynthesis